MKYKKMGFISLLMLALLLTLLFAQYELRQSYYGSGGPCKLDIGTSGYDLWGSATGQTAVTEITGGAYRDEQGFYHRSQQFYVIFTAKDMQRAAVHWDDSISVWGDTLLVPVSYLYDGQWVTDTIGKGEDSICVWVDSVGDGQYNYHYRVLAKYTGIADHRWHIQVNASDIPDSAGRVNEGSRANPAYVWKGYYEQFRSANPIVYFPDDDPTAGDVVFVDFKFCDKDSGWLDSEGFDIDHGDTVRTWYDRGRIDGSYKYLTYLRYSDTTTGGWVTLSLHVYDEDDLTKSVTNTILYRKIYQAIVAQSVLWRQYQLIASPLEPYCDTARYRSFATAHGCITSSTPIRYGDHDVQLYDDLHLSCSPSAVDSNCGKWENWYRFMWYRPATGGYIRHQGPGTYADKPPDFTLGYGFFANQQHCDSIVFDVEGVRARINDTFEIGLYKRPNATDADAWTKYNMLGNPFYHPADADTASIKWTDSRIRNHNTSTQTGPENAYSQGWLADMHAKVYRKTGSTYSYKDVPTPGGVRDSCIFEWEGFWVLVGNTTDSLSVKVDTVYRPGLLRSAILALPYKCWHVRLIAEALGQDDMPVAGDHWNYAGYSSRGSVDNAVELPDECYPPDNNPPLQLSFVKNNEKWSILTYDDSTLSLYEYDISVSAGKYAGLPIRLTWDLKDLPDGYRAFLQVPTLGNVDILARSSIILPEWRDKKVPLKLMIYPAVAEVSRRIPSNLFVGNPIPNPFNGFVSVDIGIPAGAGGQITIVVYDQSGHIVKTVFDGTIEAGTHTFTWDGTTIDNRPAASGTYFIKVTHPQISETRKMILIR